MPHHRTDSSFGTQETNGTLHYAAWNGFDSPLRKGRAPSTCLAGGHRIWWRVEAADASAAMALMPVYVAGRTDAVEVRDIETP